jgi:hypothetical protein
MARGRSSRTMLAMTPTGTALSRVLLVSDKAVPSGPDATRQAKLRRYRLARLHLDGRPVVEGRHDHLRRSYD